MEAKIPINNFSVERDISFEIYDPLTREPQRFSIKTGWSRKQLTGRITVKSLAGVVLYGEDPEGWEGTLDLERASSALDDFIASLETAYYDGKNILGATILETITEPDGRTTQYRYDGCAFKVDAGGWKKSEAVKQKLDWVASKRIKVA